MKPLVARALLATVLLPAVLLLACGSSAEVLRFDPNGPDRDCGDFRNWEEANAFYAAAGGPDRDPHGLDRDRDGIPCEALR